MDIVYIDFETGGLDPAHGAEPVELAAIMLHEDTLEEKARWGPVRMRVQDVTKLSTRALEVNGLTVAQVQQGRDPKEALVDFIGWILKNKSGAKVQLAAHNVNFDKKFLEWMCRMYLHPEAFEKLFHYHTFCTMVVANLIRLSEKSRYANPRNASCSLVNLSTALGISHAAHTAMGDVEVGVQVMRHLRQWVLAHPEVCFEGK